MILAKDEVAVVLRRLDVSADVVTTLSQHLNTEEAQRARRFQFDDHRRRFTVARGYLREFLGTLLSRSPSEVALEHNSRGKPRLGNSSPPFEFNLSHSDELVCFAFAIGRPVGVDLEKVREVASWDKVASRYFAPAEMAYLRSASAVDRMHRFFDVWTRKEAYVKAGGQGLGPGLRAYNLLSEQAGWTLAPLAMPTGFQGALCHSGGPARLRIIDLSGTTTVQEPPP